VCEFGNSRHALTGSLHQVLFAFNSFTHGKNSADNHLGTPSLRHTHRTIRVAGSVDQLTSRGLTSVTISCTYRNVEHVFYCGSGHGHLRSIHRLTSSP